MDYKDVLEHLSPCGLDCSRCADYEQGEIKQLSSGLAYLLGNYKPVAKMKKEIIKFLTGTLSSQKSWPFFRMARVVGAEVKMSNVR